MEKHSEQIKLLAVQDYWSGKAGLKGIAEAHNVNISSLRRWVAAYREQGVAGIQERSLKRVQYSPEFKLSVICRMTDEGLSHRQAAALFNIRNFNMISQWAQRYEEGGVEALSDRRRNSTLSKRRRDQYSQRLIQWTTIYTRTSNY